jgi:hypothetical protein
MLGRENKTFKMLCVSSILLAKQRLVISYFHHISVVHGIFYLYIQTPISMKLCFCEFLSSSRCLTSASPSNCTLTMTKNFQSPTTNCVCLQTCSKENTFSQQENSHKIHFRFLSPYSQVYLIFTYWHVVYTHKLGWFASITSQRSIRSG